MAIATPFLSLHIWLKMILRVGVSRVADLPELGSKSNVSKLMQEAYPATHRGPEQAVFALPYPVFLNERQSSQTGVLLYGALVALKLLINITFHLLLFNTLSVEWVSSDGETPRHLLKGKSDDYSHHVL
ncbi:hypothetical protein ACTG16_23420 [Aeromonas sp. 23P]|uniref:hypothetical protein n=1 Tax=Aeromonas sp. 23P TaxID=3452716 RepID=UPI003F79A1A8